MKEEILKTVDDLVTGFLYYDRKEDEDLKVGDIDKAVKSGEITIKEMVDKFEICLRNGLE